MLFRRHIQDFSKYSDRELVAAVTSGDQNAIVYMFYTKFSATFQYHIYKLFNYKVEVSDLVDEFFMFLLEDDWRRLRSFDASKSSLSTWISTVSFRFFRDYKRSKIDLNGLVTISDKWETFRGDWMESVEAGIAMDIRAALDGIKSDRDRSIAEKLFIEDREYEAVAEEFGLTVDYVYTVKNRIVKQLRSSLKGYS
ncbi:MAG: sigma-70 family RNA polymerase sigma factor [Bacteroidales bacterium]|nr:sigma-70 family RNA polymerase sigma factor [Bacteroidales bacterium]